MSSVAVKASEEKLSRSGDCDIWVTHNDSESTEGNKVWTPHKRNSRSAVGRTQVQPL